VVPSLKNELPQRKDGKLQAATGYMCGMALAFFGKCKSLLRSACIAYVQMKQRDLNYSLGYGCINFRSRNLYKYAEDYELELQSVWIAAHR
jgi:hypothetical protein